jgi:hypothetical protein
MKKDIGTLFAQIRSDCLPNNEGFCFEIDLEDSNISKFPVLSLDDPDFIQLKESLPPSFVNFLSKYSNGLYIDIGNALRILAIGKGNTNLWADILSLTTKIVNGKFFNGYDSFPSKDFVFFASDGGGEMFAFYTGTKFENNEYPIVWFTPGSVDTEPFVLLNSSFDKFLSMQYYLMKAPDYEDMDKHDWKSFHHMLYDTFDPIIPKPNDNYFKSVTAFEELLITIDKAKSNRR